MGMDHEDRPSAEWVEIKGRHADACTALLQTSAFMCYQARQLVAQSQEAVTQSQGLLRQTYVCPRVRERPRRSVASPW